MNRERALTIAGGFVAVVMVALLSYTTINGRTFGPPGDSHGDEVNREALERELRGLVLDQEAYRERQRTYTTSLEELDFQPHNQLVVISVPAADGRGWTGVAAGLEAGVVCVLRIGEGEAAEVEVDLYIASLEGDFEQVDTCEVADSTGSPSAILGFLDSRS